MDGADEKARSGTTLVTTSDDGLLARALVWTSVFAGTWLVASILILGREVLIPIAVAVMLWLLLNGIARLYSKLEIGGIGPPMFVCRLAAIATVVLACWLIVDIVARNVAEVRVAAPDYEANLRLLIDRATHLFGTVEMPTLAQLLERINLASLITALSGALAGLVGNAGLVALYVMFLLAEQSSFDGKMQRLFPDAAQRERVSDLLADIERRIERYLWIKTVVSILTAILCWGVLAYVDVDYAGFWALTVFLLNYIPNIGSLFAVLLPSLLTVLQFASVGLGVVVLLALTGIQFFVGNIVEPRMMGNSLNLSPLVIILSLTLWGSIWGIAGMFLCVPMTVIMTIVLSYFELTRPLAILLSADGRIGR